MSACRISRAIIRGRRLTRDGRGMAVAQLDELLDASGRIVKREGLHSGVVGEEPSALRQCNWMREDSIDVADSARLKPQ